MKLSWFLLGFYSFFLVLEVVDAVRSKDARRLFAKGVLWLWISIVIYCISTLIQPAEGKTLTRTHTLFIILLILEIVTVFSMLAYMLFKGVRQIYSCIFGLIRDNQVKEFDAQMKKLATYPKRVYLLAGGGTLLFCAPRMICAIADFVNYLNASH